MKDYTKLLEAMRREMIGSTIEYDGEECVIKDVDENGNILIEKDGKTIAVKPLCY